MEIASARDILKFANQKGEIGYAYGGDDRHLPFVLEAKRRGWIKWGYDASQSALVHPRPQTRDVYFITSAGREALKESHG